MPRIRKTLGAVLQAFFLIFDGLFLLLLHILSGLEKKRCIFFNFLLAKGGWFVYKDNTHLIFLP